MFLGSDWLEMAERPTIDCCLRFGGTRSLDDVVLGLRDLKATKIRSPTEKSDGYVLTFLAIRARSQGLEAVAPLLISRLGRPQAACCAFSRPSRIVRVHSMRPLEISS